VVFQTDYNKIELQKINYDVILVTEKRHKFFLFLP